MEPVEISAPGLRLRPFQPEDAEPVWRACQDPQIQRWTGVPSPYTRADAEAFVTRVSPAAWAGGTGAPFAVLDADSGDLVASCGLISIDNVVHSAELGFWTAPWARNAGVASRASRAVAAWAFDRLDLRRLVWQAELGNHASRLVALRAGFRIEGQLRLANPRPGGSPHAWVGSLLPGDVTGDGATAGAPDPLTVRRAAVFGRPQPVLFANTPRHGEISLRPMRQRDLDAVVATCRDEATVRWTTVPEPYGPGQAEQFLLDVAQPAWAAGSGAFFAVADPDDSYAGSIDLHLSPADPLVADVGFMVAPWARGRGYAPAALGALTAWGFATLGLARIEWRAFVGNAASRRAAEKAGFRMEGTARQALVQRGVRHDAWVAALLPPDAPGGAGPPVTPAH